jgi:hypothetical protein
LVSSLGKAELLLVACDKLDKDDMRWAPLVCELPLCVSGLPRVSRLDYCVMVMWVLLVC